jgi:hypothetical protein
MIADWPTPDPARRDEEAERRDAAFKEFITTLRSLRKE